MTVQERGALGPAVVNQEAGQLLRAGQSRPGFQKARRGGGYLEALAQQLRQRDVGVLVLDGRIGAEAQRIEKQTHGFGRILRDDSERVAGLMDEAGPFQRQFDMPRLLAGAAPDDHAVFDHRGGEGRALVIGRHAGRAGLLRRRRGGYANRGRR